MHKELFLRKRKKQVGKAINILDFDFNLGTISESDSSGDETFLVPANKDRAKSMKSRLSFHFLWDSVSQGICNLSHSVSAVTQSQF